METTSRYEALLSLQKQKTDLVREINSFPEQVIAKKREIRDLKRQLEDREEALVEFESRTDSIKAEKQALITAVEEGIKQFTSLSQQTKN